MTTERDRLNQLDYARQEGLQKGMQEGRESAARKLAELGVDPDIIEKATGVRVD